MEGQPSQIGVLQMQNHMSHLQASVDQLHSGLQELRKQVGYGRAGFVCTLSLRVCSGEDFRRRSHHLPVKGALFTGRFQTGSTVKMHTQETDDRLKAAMEQNLLKALPVILLAMSIVHHVPLVACWASSPSYVQQMAGVYTGIASKAFSKRGMQCRFQGRDQQQHCGHLLHHRAPPSEHVELLLCTHNMLMQGSMRVSLQLASKESAHDSGGALHSCPGLPCYR